MSISAGERLIGELLDDPQRFGASGRAYDLLQEYFSGLPIETLRPLLRSENIFVQRAASFIAAELGKQALLLLNDVIPLVESPDRHVQNYAMEVLTVCCEDENAEAFGHVVKKVNIDDEGLRLQAMDLVANATVQQLEAAARFFGRQPNQESHIRGLRLLAAVDQMPPNDIDGLLGDPDPLIRRYGAIARKRLGQFL